MSSFGWQKKVTNNNQQPTTIPTWNRTLAKEYKGESPGQAILLTQPGISGNIGPGAATAPTAEESFSAITWAHGNTKYLSGCWAVGDSKPFIFCNIECDNVCKTYDSYWFSNTYSIYRCKKTQNGLFPQPQTRRKMKHPLLKEAEKKKIWRLETPRLRGSLVWFLALLGSCPKSGRWPVGPPGIFWPQKTTKKKRKSNIHNVMNSYCNHII